MRPGYTPWINGASSSASVLVLLLLAAAGAHAQAPAPKLTGPYVDRDVCPFQCCIYRRWTARARIPVYRKEGVADQPVRTLKPGDRFRARTGNIHLDSVGVVVLTLPFQLRDDTDTLPPIALKPGDSVYVLTSLGERRYRVWRRGQVRHATAFWLEPGESGSPSSKPGRLARASGEEAWWVEIRDRNARPGWIRVGDELIDGMNRCG
jgi:hypothetical protein